MVEEHGKASARRIRNCISGSFDENGAWCVNKTDVQGLLTDIFWGNFGLRGSIMW